MYETHKFMKLNKNQISFFNTQVEKAALSLGVTAGDATTIKNTLEAVFNVQCAAPAKVGGLDGYQGLCATSECKVADPKNCPSDFKSSAKGMFTGSWLLVVAMLAVSL